MADPNVTSEEVDFNLISTAMREGSKDSANPKINVLGTATWPGTGCTQIMKIFALASPSGQAIQKGWKVRDVAFKDDSKAMRSTLSDVAGRVSSALDSWDGSSDWQSITVPEEDRVSDTTYIAKCTSTPFTLKGIVKSSDERGEEEEDGKFIRVTVSRKSDHA